MYRCPRIRILSALALVALGLAGPTLASAVDPSLFQDLHWRSIGPFRGGRVLAVEGAPDDPRRFYFGAVNGGVWKTDDAGRTWTPIFDEQPVGSIGAIAVAPTSPKTLYVGTGEADMRSDIAQGVGMFKTTDGGATWSTIGLADTQAIARIDVDPRDPQTLLVAALGHPYGPNAERGVFRSTDGGRTWAKTLFRNADTGAIDLVRQPDNPDIVYAALWQTRRPPWNTYPASSGPGGGVFRSIDGGRTWTELKSVGLPAQPGRIGLAVTPADPKRVYAIVDAKEGGLYRSDDAGATWKKISGDPRIWQRGWYFSSVTIDPANADRVYVCNTVVLKSEDGGAHFIALKGDPTGDDYHALWIDPKQPDRRILGVDQGALVSINGGATWSSWFNQPTGQFYHVATDTRFPYWVYGAQQDSGAAAVPSRSDSAFDGINMTHFREITAGGESDEIAPDPLDPDTIYGGRVDKLDLRSGQSRNVDPTLAYPDNYRGEWTLPLTFAKRSHDLYFGNQRIFRTSDGGEHWSPISPDLTRKTLFVPPNLDATTAANTAEPGPRRGVVYDIGPSPLVDGLIWAGTDDGMVWKTPDNGGHWGDVTPNGLRPWSKIGTVEPSHFDADTAYLAVDRHRVDDFDPYIYRTRDGGHTWTLTVSGIAEGGSLNAVNVVREDPAQKGLLFAGTERGAYVSFDDGDHWQTLQNGLPHTSVRDITIHENDLVIATHGRGFYILDNITTLRALARDASPATRLVPLAPAIRLNTPPFTGTPMPRDEPLAQNPPDGAVIDYIVGGSVKPVQISVFDPTGALVSRGSSSDSPPVLDPAVLPTPTEWIPTPRPPVATPGHHRYVWNLRYASPLAEPFASTGIWAPPGIYTVELSADGVVQRQTLEVRPDPRIHVSPEALQAQFALARRIEELRLKTREALPRCDALKAKLETKRGKTAPNGSPGNLSALAKLDAVCDFPAPEGFGLNTGKTPSTRGLHDIATRLANLARVVDGADAAPSTDAVSAVALAQKDLDAALAELAKLLGRPL